MFVNFLSTLFGGAGAIKKVAEVFVPNAEKSAQRAATEQMELMKSYQAEFSARQNRTWIDAIADGFNRLIRPLIASAVLASFALVFFNPEKFVEVSEALTFMPDGYWALLSVVIAFYFGGRMQLKSQDFKFKEAQAKAISELIEKRTEFRKLEMDDDEPDKLIGEEAKTVELEKQYAQQHNKIASGFRKAREKRKQIISDVSIAKQKMAEESGTQVDAPWPDEMFGEM